MLYGFKRSHARVTSQKFCESFFSTAKTLIVNYVRSLCNIDRTINVFTNKNMSSISAHRHSEK